MTTQDYINEEIRRDRDGTLQPTDQHGKQWPFAQILGGDLGPSELILLRAKVRELSDQLAGERGRAAKIAEAEACGWDCDCGEDHCKNIAAKITEGE